jgi:HEPN domain-containing protein
VNAALATDYVRRAEIRLRAIDVLFDGQSWVDVVCKSQEVVELALKGLLRRCGVDPPRTHDVSDVLLAERDRLPAPVRAEIEELAAIARDLGGGREVALHGAENLTPSSFCSRDDAVRARAGAALVVRVVGPCVT